ncbi:hypothetical protein [Longitalea luteola]|uniref:hypothetical protein n=1 Tax=Longitalea luteola TaxID=2812563 RepID=UPI001A977B28|nr:hypothetical protein [Longitalea luteola]
MNDGLMIPDELPFNFCPVAHFAAGLFAKPSQPAAGHPGSHIKSIKICVLHNKAIKNKVFFP